MTGNEYQVAALRTANVKEASIGRLLINGVMGLCGEAGECIDLLKKASFQGHQFDRKKFAEELGDVAWYLAVSAFAAGYDLDYILQKNVEKLWERYPDGFTSEQSIHRKEYEHGSQSDSSDAVSH